MATESFAFTGTVIEWRGPAPFLFLPLPESLADLIRADAAALSYGWGVVPCTAWIGDVEFTTSLIPRHGGYLLPIKALVQRGADVHLGDIVDARIALGSNA